jgi:spore coat protein U-like protein
MNMARLILRALFVALLLAGGAPALAQTCTVTAANINSGSAYNPFSATSNDTSGIFSIDCTRNFLQTRFPAQFLLSADNGANFAGGSRRLRMGATGNYLNYALHRTYAACNQAWTTTTGQVYTFNNSATGLFSTATNPDPLTGGTSYCLRIAGLQNTAPPGTYTDTVNLRVYDANGRTWGTDSVTFTTTIVAACGFTTPPGNITLNYISFATVATTASSAFQLRCTNTTTYTMALGATTGTALGLNYTLALSAAGGTGSGVGQSYTINANMPAGQSGTCAGASCTATSSQTLTVTY